MFVIGRLMIADTANGRLGGWGGQAGGTHDIHDRLSIMLGRVCAVLIPRIDYQLLTLRRFLCEIYYYEQHNPKTKYCDNLKHSVNTLQHFDSTLLVNHIVVTKHWVYIFNI